MKKDKILLINAIFWCLLSATLLTYLLFKSFSLLKLLLIILDLAIIFLAIKYYFKLKK